MLRTIDHAKVVTPEGLVDGASVIIREGRVAGVSRSPERAGENIDAAGRYVLPGMVDLHSDAIEVQLSPRPEAELPPALALLEMDRLFAASGITTGHHALTFIDNRDRSVLRARKLYALVSENRHEGLVRHELHLRCELPQEGALLAVESLLADGRARIASLMDHSLGQGKFRDPGWFEVEYRRAHPWASEEQVAAAFVEATALEDGHPLASDRIGRIARAAKVGGALLASHDDETPDKAEGMARHGAKLSEFPIDAATARRARDLGLAVCMGAPNVVRGGSTGTSIPAVEAAKLGLVDILCSDYHPPSMLQAAFRLAGEGVMPLHEAVGLVSSGPARAVGFADRGEIREGALADLIVVGERFGLPVVTHTIVGGEVVLASGGRTRQPSNGATAGAPR